MARPPWTGWNRSRSAASRSRRPRRPASGRTIASTSSTHRDTWTLRSKSNARCECWMARSPCSAASAASSRSPRPSGARRTATACRASRSSTRWTASAPNFDRVVEMMRARLGTNPVPIQLPIGSEDTFRGVVDVLERKAIYWDDESLGASFQVADLPAELEAATDAAREKVVEAAADADESLMALYLEGAPIAAGHLRTGAARGDAPAPRRTGRLRLGLQEQGCAAAARRDRLLPAVAARRAAGRRHRSPHGEAGHAQGRRRRALRRARLQADVRQARRTPDLSACLLGQHRDGPAGPQRPPRPQGARRSAAPDARQQASGDSGGVRRRHHRGRRLQVGLDRRHALRPAASDRARGDAIPRTGDLDRDRAEDPGRHGPPRRVARAPRRRKTPRSASRRIRRRVRRSSPGWASCTSRSSATACSASSASAPTSGRRRSRTRRRSARRCVRRVATSSRPAAPATTAWSCSKWVRTRRARASSSSTPPRARRFRASTFPPIRNGCEEALQSGELAGYPVVDVRVRLLDGQAHDVDSSERSFKIAGSIAVREALRQAQSDAARADDEGRSRHARRLRGSGAGRPEQPPRIAHRDRGARRRACRARRRAARCDVRIREQPAFDDTGSRDLHDAVLPLRGSAGRGRRENRQIARRGSTWARRSSSGRSRT